MSFLRTNKNEDLPLASCFKTTKKGAPSKKTGPLVYLQLTWPVAVFSSFLHVCVLGAGLHVTSPGNELDKKKVPKVHLATNKTKGGKVNVLRRRDQLRFLKATEPAKFVDGVKEQLSDQQVGMAFWLGCGIPPWHKLREMRCRNLGQVSFG